VYHSGYMAKPKTPAEFYTSPDRGKRGVERSPFHIRLTLEERAKLAKLTHKHKLSAADVVRMLIEEARA